MCILRPLMYINTIVLGEKMKLIIPRLKWQKTWLILLLVGGSVFVIRFQMGLASLRWITKSAYSSKLRGAVKKKNKIRCRHSKLFMRIAGKCLSEILKETLMKIIIFRFYVLLSEAYKQVHCDSWIQKIKNSTVLEWGWIKRPPTYLYK